MKKFATLILALSAYSACFGAEAVSDAVACMGKVLPGDRIAKLTAASPAGAQTVIETLLVKRGDFVEAGAVIATIRGIDKAKASFERAKAALAAAKSAGEIRVLQQKNLIADLQGSFEQNRKVLDEKSPPRREREEIEYEQESLLRKISQAKSVLPLVEKNEFNVSAEASAALAEAEKHLDEFTLRAPIAGEIIELNCELGESVGQDGVCEIANTRTMFVNAEVYVADISKIKVGDSAEIYSDALGNEKFAGKVVQISGYVKSNRVFSSDPTDYSNTKVVIAKIQISNPEKFKNLIGSQVNVRILAK